MNVIIGLFSGILAVGILYTVTSILFVRLSKHYQILSVDEFKKQLAMTEEALLIDVRTPREFKKHRIVGACNINFLSMVFRRKIRKLDNGKPVMVYCHSGYRSKMALPEFRKAGFTTIYELHTGFMGWLKAGKPKLLRKTIIY
jgi:rhodanese-related sulfurtransferase